MQSLNFDDGKIRLCVNDDETKVIAFAPDDVGFMNRYYGLIDFLDKKQKHYINTAQTIEDESIDKMRDGLRLLQTMCEDVKEQIDIVFGKGTSEKVFGDCIRLDMFEQFFNGISPYIEQARKKKMEKYLAVSMPGVMQ